MSQGHIRTILPQQGGVSPVDSNTVALFHFDEHAKDVIMGIQPAGYPTALALNGNNEYVLLTNLNPTTAITVEVWFKTDQFPSVGGKILGKHSNPSDCVGTLGLHTDGTVLIEVTAGGAYKLVQSPSSIPLNTWTHIAGTYDGANVILYVNGNEVARTAATGAIATNNLAWTIGRLSSFHSGGYIKGSYSEVRIWSIARSATDIKEWMNKPLVGNEAGLLGYWKLHEGSGQIANDYSSSGNDGVIIGGKWVEGRAIYSLVKDGYPGGEDKGILVEEGTINLSKHSTANATVPSGYYVIGNTLGGVNLETMYTNSGHTAVYSSDVPPEAKEKRSIEFTHSLTSDAYAWFGTSVTPVAGKSYTFSCWIKFLDADPNTYSKSNFGFKQHQPTTLYNDWVAQCKQNEWAYVTATYTATTNTANSHLLIFDSITRGHRVRFCDFQIEEKPFPTSFVDSTRGWPRLMYPPSILNDNAGTISFWCKHLVHPSNWTNGQNENGYYFAINKDKSSSYANITDALCLVRMNKSTTHIRLLAADASKAKWTYDVPFDYDENWHHYAISWDKVSNKIKFYIDGEIKVNASPTAWFSSLSSLEHFFALGSWYVDSGWYGTPGIVLDELRIDKVARTPDEIMAWYYQGR